MRRRTIYFNDARHYYLYVFEPPMTLEDAWRPVDEVAGTAVDTFIYGVACGHVFYDSKVDRRWGVEQNPVKDVWAWRAWKNLQSLIDRGLDPLNVLIDRAHYYGMDFFASLRLGGSVAGIPDFPAFMMGIDPKYRIGVSGAMGGGGGGQENCADFAYPEVRDHRFRVLEELATRYPVEGVELDFAFTPFYFKPEEVKENTPVMTEYVRKISEMIRSRPGRPAEVGARVFPTENMCLASGLDVRTWLEEGLLDYVVPLYYGYFILDPDMPIDWLIQAAHASNTSVYAMLQPYWTDATTPASSLVNSPHPSIYATPAMMRAAAANFWNRGADGLYTWFLHWPLGDVERGILTELGDPEVAKEGSKQYVLRRRQEAADALGYDATLPLEIPSADPGKRYGIPFYLADDLQGAADHVREVKLLVNVRNLVSADSFSILLNGQSLAGEDCKRTFERSNGPYDGQWLELTLKGVRPTKGENLLEVSLDKRPDGLEGGVTVRALELLVEYGPYPSRLS